MLVTFGLAGKRKVVSFCPWSGDLFVEKCIQEKQLVFRHVECFAALLSDGVTRPCVGGDVILLSRRVGFL